MDDPAIPRIHRVQGHGTSTVLGPLYDSLGQPTQEPLSGLRISFDVQNDSFRVRIGARDRLVDQQLERIHEITQKLKKSQQALGVEMMMQVAEVMPTALLSLGVQAASGSMNSIVTNVPGPQFPLYLLGAEMQAMYPQVPLLQNVGLGIALISYDGRVCWGFNADAVLVPDLAGFVSQVEAAFGRVAEAAGVKLGVPPEA